MQNANRWRHLRVLVLASLALPLACCGRHNADFAAPLKVDLSQVCEDILTAPALPAAGPDDDAITAFLENRAVAIIAIETIVAGRDCVRDERIKYSGLGEDR